LISCEEQRGKPPEFLPKSQGIVLSPNRPPGKHLISLSYFPIENHQVTTVTTMNLFILQEKLKEGLNTVERAISKSLTLPVLNNVLIRADKNFINLTTTDLETGINWWSLAKVEKKGEIAVPVSPLFGLLSFLPEKQINLQVKDGSLQVECDDFKTQIKGVSPDEFPIIPQVPTDNYVELNSSVFCLGLAQVADIATISQARPEISGVYFSFSNDGIKLAATDSFRLGEKTLLFEKMEGQTKNTDKEVSFILPQKTAKEIINIFGEKEEKIRIYFSPNQVMFESQMEETAHPRAQLVSRLIEGEYPAYQEIIPKKCDTQIVAGRNEFLNQIKIAALFSSKINEIKFKIESQKSGMEIFSQNPDIGEHRSFLAGKTKGGAIDVAFNHRFLTDGLLNIKSSEVLFELSKEEGPAVLKPVGEQSYLYVVMPIKAS
jgi:DNA polymerase-3 subunit beta